MRSTKADFSFDKQVGTGTYGIVWQTRRKQDGKTYAVKELDLRYLEKQGIIQIDAQQTYKARSAFNALCCSRQEQAACIQEVKVLSRLDSPYIIKYYDSFLDQVGFAAKPTI